MSLPELAACGGIVVGYLTRRLQEWFKSQRQQPVASRKDLKDCKDLEPDSFLEFAERAGRKRFADDRWACVTGIVFGDEATNLLLHVREWNFDVLRFARLPEVAGRPLLVLGAQLLNSCVSIAQHPDATPEAMLWPSTHAAHPYADLCRRLVSFLGEIELGYLNNPYHNNVHACDVMQTMNCFFETEVFRRMGQEQLFFNRLVALMAAAMHDVGHTGQSNPFHVATSSDLAIMYNDCSVLENMHVSSAFQLMRQKPETDWISSFQKEFTPTNGKTPLKLQARFRKYLIQMVLATDNAKHAEQVKATEAWVQTQNWAEDLAKDGKEQVGQQELFLLEVSMHAADISNPTKVPSLSIPWAGRVVEEFWSQGDLEKKALGAVSMPMYDRDLKDVPGSQIGFINYVVVGLYRPLAKMMPEFEEQCEQIEQNLKFWQSQKNQGKKELPPANDWPSAPHPAPSSSLHLPPQRIVFANNWPSAPSSLLQDGRRRDQQ